MLSTMKSPNLRGYRKKKYSTSKTLKLIILQSGKWACLIPKNNFCLVSSKSNMTYFPITYLSNRNGISQLSKLHFSIRPRRVTKFSPAYLKSHLFFNGKMEN